MVLGLSKVPKFSSQPVTAIYEFLIVDDSIRQLILRKVSADEISKAAQERGGMRSLRQDGFRKVLAGVTTAEEVLRVS